MQEQVIQPPRTRPVLVGLSLLLIAGGVLALLGPWSDIWRVASQDPEMSHIFLVPFVAGWLVYVRRARLAEIEFAPSLAGPLLIALGWGMCHYGFYHPGSVQCLVQGGAVVVMIGAVATFLGLRVLVEMWPAVLVLAFMVPVPGRVRMVIAQPMQNATAHATAWILGLFTSDIQQVGMNLTINGVPVRVEEGCNGMRMAFPLFLISYAFCFGTPLKAWVRALIVLLSGPAAIACNVLRLLPTVWLYGHATTAVGDRFHDISGWLMLPIAFAGLMGVVKLLRMMHLQVQTPLARM